MEGYQCCNCSYETMINIAFYPICRKQGFQEIEVPNEGTVYSYTTIWDPSEFISKAPHQVALGGIKERLELTVFIQEKVHIEEKVVFKKMDTPTFAFKPKN